MVKIEDVCSTKPQYGYTTKASDEGTWHLLRTTDITKGKIDWDTVPYCSIDPKDPEKYELKEGDIVISRAGSVGVSYLIEKPRKSVFASYLIRFNPDCDKQYFKYFLESPSYWQAISDVKLGIAVPNVNATKLKNINFPLPPLPEQRAIVAKLERLLGELDRSVAELEAARAKLGVWRQSVLREAFSGPSVLNQLPLKQIATSCLGKMLDKRKNEGDPQPYLANINVRWGAFDLDSLRTMKFKANAYERYGVRRGDLIICEGGEPGRCAVWSTDEKVFIQKALHRVRPLQGYNSNYLYYYFTYAAATNLLDRHFTGTTIKHLTGRKLKEVEIPLPSTLIEQRQIVQQLETRFSVADKLEEEIGAGLERARGLRQGVLRRAFAGELVEQKSLLGHE